MLSSVLLQPAYVLHTRAYRDTSLLLELFTLEHGRISALARGARGNKSRLKGLLQPFVPLLVSWRGRGELMNLNIAEACGTPHGLMREALFCGIYLNELLVRLLHRYDAHPHLYDAYQKALIRLQGSQAQQLTLRLFEKNLLVELGYALQLDRETTSGAVVVPEQFYYFEPTQGLARSNNATQTNVFSGTSLLALHYDELHEQQHLRDAKRLLRIAINHLLGGKPIRSRELFF